MIIPVAMMFDDNFIIQAGVAIYSLLANANPENNFELYVMHTDITDAHMEKLQSIVAQFSNAKLTFMNMSGYELPDMTKNGICTKEIVYKLVVASVFPQFDKIIVTDVDVVFMDDVAPEFIAFDTDEYFAGVKHIGTPQHRPFSANIADKDVQHFVVGGGYLIYNLKQMRADNMEQKYIDFAITNAQHLHAQEQDVLNMVSYPKIKLLHPRNMVLASWYLPMDFSQKFDFMATMDEFESAKKSPVQLHYVSYWPIFKKVWDDPSAPRANVFFEYLTRTPFLAEYFEKYWVLKSSLPKPKKHIPFWRRLIATFIPVKKWRKMIKKN